MLERFEARMLSGEPFTQEGLKRTFSTNEAEARLIELRLQQFHRQGLIEHARHGLRLTWIATEFGNIKLNQESR
jgi:hypothetical protein